MEASAKARDRAPNPTTPHDEIIRLEARLKALDRQHDAITDGRDDSDFDSEEREHLAALRADRHLTAKRLQQVRDDELLEAALHAESDELARRYAELMDGQDPFSIDPGVQAELDDLDAQIAALEEELEASTRSRDFKPDDIVLARIAFGELRKLHLESRRIVESGGVDREAGWHTTDLDEKRDRYIHPDCIIGRIRSGGSR